MPTYFIESFKVELFLHPYHQMETLLNGASRQGPAALVLHVSDQYKLRLECISKETGLRTIFLGKVQFSCSNSVWKEQCRFTGGGRVLRLSSYPFVGPIHKSVPFSILPLKSYIFLKKISLLILPLQTPGLVTNTFLQECTFPFTWKFLEAPILS